MYQVIFFEISGICNSKCRYCVNGGEHSILGPFHRNGAGMIDVGEFSRAIAYMLDHGIIGAGSLVRLFNWGEPFLYPNLKEIIAILNDRNLFYGFSTNASRKVYFDNDVDLRGMKEIYFSMPGFSQASYDRIHGFSFERIKENIRDILAGVRGKGFKGTTKIFFHLYRFNTEELGDAKEFARELDIGIVSYGAYFNSHSMFRDYFTDRMEPQVRERACSELFTDYLDEYSLKRPSGYLCPQTEFLTIDEYCNVLTCCAVDRFSEGYSIGNLFDLSLQEIEEKRRNQPICRECGQIGIDFVGDNPMPENWLLRKGVGLS